MKYLLWVAGAGRDALKWISFPANEPKSISSETFVDSTVCLGGEEERQWWCSLTEAQRQLMQGGKDGPRNPWIYSVGEDRKTVETFLDYAYEQGLTPERYQIEDLFVPSTLDL